MLHITRDKETHTCLYRIDTENSDRYQLTNGDKRDKGDNDKLPMVPIINNPLYIPFKKWYDTYKNEVTHMVDTIISTMYSFQSEHFLLKITEDDTLRENIALWIYKCSLNKHKRFM